MRPLLFAAATAACIPVVAQSNTVPGLAARLTNIASPTYFGRRGAAYPNGEIGMSYSYTMCNSGTVLIPWQQAGAGPGAMQVNHPKFAFMVVREANGRMEQITDARTFTKHAFAAANSASVCGTCQNPGSGAVVGIGCADTYGASTNANRYWLGPDSEIDPWSGIWNPIHSYFDRSDPEVAFPGNQDGVRSLTNGNFADTVKNRVTLREADLLVAGRFFCCMHLVVEGEDGDDHLDNLVHRQMVPAWNGTQWTFGTSGVGLTQGSALNQWAGASVSSGRNGDDDGHFIVALKVTGPAAGLWHYEYAVHDFDNARGGASLRIPVCPSTTVANVGFRDVDGNALDDWTSSRVGDELVFQAPAGNALDWNQLFNFWFDCSEAPVSGAVAIDQARPGAGALTVAVGTQIPGGSAEVVVLGPGCGAPAPVLAAMGLPTIPNPAFALLATVAPGAGVFVFASLGAASVPIAPGCTQYLDGTSLVAHGFFLAGGGGTALIPVPIPGSQDLDGLPVRWQAAEVVAGGPVFGGFALSNGLLTVVGCR